MGPKPLGPVVVMVTVGNRGPSRKLGSGAEGNERGGGGGQARGEVDPLEMPDVPVLPAREEGRAGRDGSAGDGARPLRRDMAAHRRTKSRRAGDAEISSRWVSETASVRVPWVCVRTIARDKSNARACATANSVSTQRTPGHRSSYQIELRHALHNPGPRGRALAHGKHARTRLHTSGGTQHARGGPLVVGPRASGTVVAIFVRTPGGDRAVADGARGAAGGAAAW